MKKKTYIKLLILIGIVLTVVIVHWGISALAYDGERALQMGVTLWYLNDSGRNALKIAGDSERYITRSGEDFTERIAAYIPSISTNLRGTWELVVHQNGQVLYERTTGERTDQISFSYAGYLDGQYTIFRIEEINLN